MKVIELAERSNIPYYLIYILGLLVYGNSELLNSDIDGS